MRPNFKNINITTDAFAKTGKEASLVILKTNGLRLN